MLRYKIDPFIDNEKIKEENMIIKEILKEMITVKLEMLFFADGTREWIEDYTETPQMGQEFSNHIVNAILSQNWKNEKIPEKRRFTQDYELENKIIDIYNLLDINFCYYKNILNYSNLSSLVYFIASKPLQFLKDILGTYSELYSEYKPYHEIICPRFIVSIYEKEEDMYTTSMVVKVIHNQYIKTQIHIHIHKNIHYILSKYLKNEPELRNSSILLHSFASDVFGSDEWFTNPLHSMANIMKANNIRYSLVQKDEYIETPGIKNFIRNVCGISMAGYSDTYTIVKTNDMRDIWKHNLSIIKIVKHEYITSKITTNELDNFKQFLQYQQFPQQPTIQYYLPTSSQNQQHQQISQQLSTQSYLPTPENQAHQQFPQPPIQSYLPVTENQAHQQFHQPPIQSYLPTPENQAHQQVSTQYYLPTKIQNQTYNQYGGNTNFDKYIKYKEKYINTKYQK